MKRLAGGVYHLARLLAGWAAFAVTRETPSFAYLSMINLFCRTGGASNDLMSSLIAATSPPYPIPLASGIAGPLAPADVERIAREIEATGYHVFEQRVPADLCRQLMERSLRMPATCLTVGADESSPVPFDPVNAAGAAYDCVSEAVVTDDAVQAILADESLMAVAQAYLKSAPMLSHVNLRWSAAQAAPDVEAAQYFHFDMERIKWLEFFVYVTDVDEATGPHQFVARSHRRHGIPADLLRHGYSRLSDEQVRRHYPAEDFVTFTGPAGTIIAEDSRGLHKGTALARGCRLMFNFSFTNSAFGNRRDRLPAPAHVSPALQSAISRYPRAYPFQSP